MPSAAKHGWSEASARRGFCVEFVSPVPFHDDFLSRVHAQTHAVQGQPKNADENPAFHSVCAILKKTRVQYESLSTHDFLAFMARVVSRTVSDNIRVSSFEVGRNQAEHAHLDCNSPWIHLRSVNNVLLGKRRDGECVPVRGFHVGALRSASCFAPVVHRDIVMTVGETKNEHGKRRASHCFLPRVLSDKGISLFREGSALHLCLFSHGFRFDIDTHEFVATGVDDSLLDAMDTDGTIDAEASSKEQYILAKMKLQDILAMVVSPTTRHEEDIHGNVVCPIHDAIASSTSRSGLLLVLKRPASFYAVTPGDDKTNDRQTHISMGQFAGYFGQYVTYYLEFDAWEMERVVSLVAHRSAAPLYYGFVYNLGLDNAMTNSVNMMVSEQLSAKLQVRDSGPFSFCPAAYPEQVQILLQKFAMEYPWLAQFLVLPEPDAMANSVRQAGIHDRWETYFAYKHLIDGCVQQLFDTTSSCDFDDPHDPGDWQTDAEDDINQNDRRGDTRSAIGNSTRVIAHEEDLALFVLPKRKSRFVSESKRDDGHNAVSNEASPALTPMELAELQLAAKSAHCEEHMGLITAAEVTPTRLVLKEPDAMLLNRIVREFGTANAVHNEGQCSFLRIKFADDDGSELNDLEVLQKRIDTVFDDGLTVGGKIYKWLGWSNSQMRSKGMWLYHSDNGTVSAKQIRDWVGNLGAVLETGGISKFASRLALAFSSTVPVFRVPPERVGNIKDVERDGFCFTDGGGQITRQFAEKIAKTLRLEFVPCSFQVRFGGAKGVLTVNPELNGHDVDVLLRPSQVKFKSDYSWLEILDWSKPTACSLNQQIILLMLSCVVPEESFLQPMQKELKSAADLVLNEEVAVPFLQQKKVNLDAESVRKGSLFFNVLNEPFLTPILQLQYLQTVTKLRRRTAILVPEGRSLLGIPDDCGVLEEGEVFVQISDFNERNKKTVVSQEVVITKNPCLHPGDVRRVRAVGGDAVGHDAARHRKVIEKLGHISDCIVFSVKGDRPLPDQMAGSDLDGDKYFVAWDTTLLPPKLFEPMDYTEAPLTEMDHKRKENDKIRRAICKMEGRMEEYLHGEMREYFKRSCASAGLGVCANAHKVMADKVGADSEGCLKLAQCHSDAVDFPKTGVPAEIPQDLKPTEYPAFMEKDDKPTYEQETLLTKCWQQCPNVRLKRFFVGGRNGPRDGDGQRNRRRGRNRGRNKSGRTGEIFGDRIEPQPCFLVEGYDSEQCKRDAAEQLEKYNGEIERLMTTYKVRTEAELFVDLEHQFGVSKNDRLENAKWIWRKMKEIRRNFQSELESDIPSSNRRAAAWYHAAYSQKCSNPLFSFGWLGDKYLMQNLVQFTEANRQKVHDSVGTGPSWVYEAIGDSIRECWEDSEIAERLQQLESVLEKWEVHHPGFSLVLTDPLGILSPHAATDHGKWIRFHFQGEGVENFDTLLAVMKSLDPDACCTECPDIGGGADLPSMKWRVSFWPNYIADQEEKGKLLDDFVGHLRALCEHRSPAEVLPLIQFLVGWIESTDLPGSTALQTQDVYSILLWFLIHLKNNSISDSSGGSACVSGRDSRRALVKLITDAEAEFAKADVQDQESQKLSETLGGGLSHFLNLVSAKTSYELEEGIRDSFHNTRFEHGALATLLRDYQMKPFRAVSTALSRAAKEIVLERSVHGVMEAKASRDPQRVLRKKFVLNNIDAKDVPVFNAKFHSLVSVGHVVSQDQKRVDSDKWSYHIEIVTTSISELKAASALKAKLQDKIIRYGSLQKSAVANLSALACVQNMQNDGVKHLVQQSGKILQSVQEHQVTVLTSPTGCGKTTMIPLAILNEDPTEFRKILCTEIRRVATVAAAKRVGDLAQSIVAADLHSSGTTGQKFRFGREIGYQIGGDAQSGRDTELLFCIDAIAMMYALQNNVLPFTHAIIDEVHARTVYCDIFMALLKYFHLKTNPNLKLIIMSASGENEKYIRYFSDHQAGSSSHSIRCNLLEIGSPHRFRVDVRYLESQPVAHQRYLEAAANRGRHQLIPALTADDISEFIADLHRKTTKNSTFLVFLPGGGEIRDVRYFLTETKYAPEPHEKQWQVVPMSGGISVEQQEKALEKQKSVERMIVLATDVGESSITIPDCDVVIDTCLHKRMRPEVGKRELKLTLEYITKAEAKQRAGRTGRLADGIVYRLVPQYVYSTLREYPQPAILTSNVADVLLLLQEHLPKFAVNVDVKDFLSKYLIDPLPRDQIDKGYQDLKEGGAIAGSISAAGSSSLGSSSRITELGKLMKELYFDIEYVKLIFNGLRYGVVEDTILLVAVYRQGSPFLQDDHFDPEDRLRLIDIRRSYLGSSSSDALTRANAVKVWMRSNVERWKNPARHRGNLASSRSTQSMRGWDFYASNAQLVADCSHADLHGEAQWCWDHYLDVVKLREMEDICNHIWEVLRRLSLVRSDSEFIARIASASAATTVSISRESLERRTLTAKRMNVRLRQISYVKSASAQQEIENLLRKYADEKTRLDNENLILWCLASSFSHNIFDSEGLAANTQLTYTVRNPQKQRRRHRRNGNWSANERLRWFLQDKMRFRIDNMRPSSTFKDSQDFLVTFCSATDANRARQLKDPYNYTKISTDAEVTERRSCFTNGEKVILPSDTVCDLSGRHTIIVGDTTTTGNVVLCHDISILPPHIAIAVLAVSYPGFPNNCMFKGEAESFVWNTIRDRHVKELCEQVRSELDSEFRLPLNRRGTIVEGRRKVVLKIVQHYKRLATSELSQLHEQADRDRKIIELISVFSLLAGQCGSDRVKGVIIGKGGSKIRELQTQSGCKIELSKTSDMISLAGTKEQIEKAKTLLKQTVGNGLGYL